MSRLAILIASSIEAMSTEDIGLAAEIRRVDEIEMRLEVDIDDCDDRPDATEEEGEIDRGVEMSELEVLYA